MSDITVKVAGGKFNYRVGAIIIDGDKTLMVKNVGMDFYYTVGGRIQFGECAYEAVLREAFEETQIKFEIDRLVFVHENFFVFRETDEFIHEVCMFFLFKPNERLKNMKHSKFKEEYGDVEFHWIPIDKMQNVHMYPEFFKTELLNLSHETKYFVTKEDVTTLVK